MGRIVVITGGTSGIGLTLKELFEKNGDTVLTFSIDDTGDQNHYYGSVSHEIKVKQVFNDIHERFGTIDILINNAGIGMSAITELAPMEDIKNVMDINFYGTLYCTRAALPHMNSGAKIINMSSAMALFPVPFRSIYGSTKAAVLNLSLSMRMELAPLGIDVIAMCPGDTKTNFSKSRLKDFTTNERYGDRLEIATLSSDAKEEKRMPATYVAEQIFKLINKKKSKPFYIIGGKYKFLYFLTRLTPKSLLINATAKVKGGNNKKIEPKKKQTREKVTEEPVSKDEYINEQVSEPAVEPDKTKTEENVENKPNLNNILSKISILNKPTSDNDQTNKTPETEVSKQKIDDEN